MSDLRVEWWIAAIVALVDAAWIAAGGWRLESSACATTGIVIAAFLLPLVLPRYRSDEKLVEILPFCAWFFAFTPAAQLLSYLVASLGAPLIDARLAAMDQVLGFNWLGLYDWMRAHPWLRVVLNVVYWSGPFQILLLALYLGIIKRAAQLREFTQLFAVSVLVTIACSALFPAGGPWLHFVPSSPDASFVSHFAQLRDGSMRQFDLNAMQGLVAMPSMHMAMALLFIYAARGTRLFRLVCLWNAAMVVSTPIEGGHYLVDLVAGAGMVVALIYLRRRIMEAPIRLAKPWQ